MNLKKILSLMLAAVLLLLTGCSFPTFSSQSMPDPRQTLTAFVDKMKERDFDGAQSLVANYSSFAFDRYEELEEGSADRLIVDLLLDSYSIDYDGYLADKVTSGFSAEGITVEGREAHMTFRFRRMKLEAISDKLTELVSEAGTVRTRKGETFDDEESALALVNEMILRLVTGMEDSEQFCSTDEFTVTAVYEKGKWYLEMTEDFYSALTGR